LRIGHRVELEGALRDRGATWVPCATSGVAGSAMHSTCKPTRKPPAGAPL
jgi:hypothetical protein